MSNSNFKEELNQHAKGITNINQLEKEILRLKLRIKTLKSNWQNNNDTLKENLGDIFLHSILKKFKQSNQVWVNVVQMVMQNPSFQQFFSTISNLIAEKWKSFFIK
jgi:hypothetical protein